MLKKKERKKGEIGQDQVEDPTRLFTWCHLLARSLSVANSPPLPVSDGNTEEIKRNLVRE